MEGDRTAPLNCDTPVRTQSMALTVLGVTIKSFKAKREVGFYLEKHLAVNYKGGDVENGIGREVKWCEVVI